ncbi:hypothetical protein [Devosia rhizoryzae]|uniref:MBL fold metallo-hydrolase n=1 Tax=Devosia rhizoryzae TaxID=2774137 RepID=A0ABX7CCZ6_9HYPH|nr:hypothetical protein [Devosia rhizoryzae]QQR40647.1 hypothetical protein JI748_06515 [Devosia rhizoryzae]
MKLTWFGDRSFRFHLGGQIVVVEADSAPNQVDRAELTSGADVVVGFDTVLPSADAITWRPRAPQRLLDAGADLRPADIVSVGDGSLLIDAEDERPLLILTSNNGPLGRWAGKAVIILVGLDLCGRAIQLIESSAPPLIGLTGSEPEVDAAFAALRDKLGDTGLVALEPGLAVEV